MKAVILAGGYGTRLEKDLLTDTSGQFKHLVGVPKPLLPIGSKPLVSHWMNQLQRIEQIRGVYVVTNKTNVGQFHDWAEAWSEVQLVSDSSVSNETRSGAIACMSLAVDHFKIMDDVLIIAGDTLFYDDFDLKTYVAKFWELQGKDPRASMVLYVNCRDEVVHKYGILETDEHGLVTGFLEKPQPDETPSRKSCPCFYFLSKSSLTLLRSYMEETENKPLQARDTTGTFIAYLHKRSPVFAVPVSARFDVGGLQTYLECNRYFSAKSSS